MGAVALVTCSVSRLVSGWHGQARRAHLKHVLHVSDARRVDTQRLVERIRVLPNPKGGMRRGQQAGQETGGRGGGSLRDVQHGPDW